MLEKLCLRGKSTFPVLTRTRGAQGKPWPAQPSVSVGNPESGRRKVEVTSVRCVFGE